MSQVLSLIHQLRCVLAYPKTSLHACVLGIIGGICAASMIILFRLGIEMMELLFFVFSSQLFSDPAWARAIVPILAVIGIVCIAMLTGFKHYRLGLPFVIHRVKIHFGTIPFGTTINQFFGGILAIASGFVVGREGPSVHLGAAGSSFLGQALCLPYNSIRILAGCGIASAISASFNTPLAAVIFVMEVVLREYKIHIFVPVMLAAACGSVMTRAVFGVSTELQLFDYTNFSQSMLLYLIILGILLGVLATLFNRQLMFVMKLFSKVNMVTRLSIAGIITAIASFIFPQALGANFEAVSQLISNSPDIKFIALVLVVKMLLAGVAIGLGIPGGIIGPVMVLGMLSGVLLFMPFDNWIDLDQHLGSFALLGLAGMLSAVLHAPLAALTAVMELSSSPQIILPAMLVIVPAYVTTTQLFKNRSIFLQQLQFQNLEYAVNPVRESLEKIGVLAAQSKHVKQFEDLKQQDIQHYMHEHPDAVLVQKTKGELGVQFKLVYLHTSEDITRLVYEEIEGIHAQSTVAGVYDKLKHKRGGAVYIYDKDPNILSGLVTWSNVQYYLHQSNPPHST